LIPKIGARQEILYDPDLVVEEYGVQPSKMVHLRALLGDSSDNFPGVSRVPRKVLTSLLREHGTLDEVYNSSLAGITSSQYDKIKSFEEQAKKNYRLMILRDDLECVVIEATQDKKVATSTLESLDIQPESIIDAFFKSVSGQGFVKVS
jgi:5'-3' exonuclease